MFKIDIIADNLVFPEGPTVDRKKGIWFVELKGGNLRCLDLNNLTRIPIGGGPDGMAFDEHGDLYVAVYGQQSIKCIDPSEQIIGLIELPGKTLPTVPFYRKDDC